MKKYNTLFIILPMCMMQLYAMEISDPSKPDPRGICYLALMPIKILDHIASYVMESEQEFIIRATKQKEVPKCEYYFLLWDKYDGWEYNKKLMSYALFCPDETIFTIMACGKKREDVIEKPGWYREKEEKHLLIIDPRKENQQDKVIYKKPIKDCDSAVCSRQAKLIARWDWKYDWLFIENVITSKEKIIDLPKEFNVFHHGIAFNKQGTHLIVRGYYRKDKYTFPIKNDFAHIIISLKQADPNILQIHSHSLQDYFRDKFVCNKYIRGTKEQASSYVLLDRVHEKI